MASRLAPVPHRALDISSLVHKRGTQNWSKALDAEQHHAIRRCGSVDNISSSMELATLGSGVAQPSIPISKSDRFGSSSVPLLCHARFPHAYEKDATSSLLYISAPDSAALRDLSYQVSALVRSWMDVVTDAPVQSIFVGTPSVTVEKFVEHLMILLKRMKVEAFCVLHVLHHIREMMTTGGFVVCWKNVFRLLLASSVVTVKFYTDERLYNSDFASIIGLPVADINRLESHFLGLVQFRLFADEAQLLSIRENLQQFMSCPV
jgi:hypothetical protein